VKKVIETILEEEKKARDRVEAAREKAKQIRIEAETESQKILAEARQKGMEEAKTLVNQAESDAHKQKDGELAQASQLSESLWTEKKNTIDQTVEILYKKVLGEGIVAK
jgi:vacuolar-type H+-ATPase subunit H